MEIERLDDFYLLLTTGLSTYNSVTIRIFYQIIFTCFRSFQMTWLTGDITVRCKGYDVLLKYFCFNKNILRKQLMSHMQLIMFRAEGYKSLCKIQ